MGKKNQPTTILPSHTRPPVVAVLGHVDHGKTSLLDAIRKTDIAAREHGGITQSIGAFTHNNITFIDTPGHEAFTKMRSRGVTAADIAILVVASDDGVMPQTKESIAHIKAANIPFVVALTKTDLPASNPEKVKQQLVKEGVSLEGLGGDVPVVLVSSKKGKGISDLLEVIALVAQMARVGGNVHSTFEAVIIEAKRDRRKGVLVSLIVRNGTLSVGDEVRAEQHIGRVRAMLDDTGKNVSLATPGMPVEILGFSDVPIIGARVIKAKDTKPVPSHGTAAPIAHDVANSAQSETQSRRLRVILKANTQGLLEAIGESIPKDEVTILAAASGDPTEADILLAKASDAIVIGFNVKVSGSVAKLAQTEGVIINTYTLIYKLIEELAEVIALFKEGKKQEIILGKAEVLAVFPYEKKKVAGCKVVEGKVAKGDRVRIIRNGEVLGESSVASLRVGKEDIGKVGRGSECGILLTSTLDFAPADVILSVR